MEKWKSLELVSGEELGTLSRILFSNYYFRIVYFTVYSDVLWTDTSPYDADSSEQKSATYFWDYQNDS